MKSVNKKISKIILIVFISILVMPLYCYADTDSSIIDLSDSATISASSYETVYGSHGKDKNLPENAVDGNKSTLWVSDGKVDSWFMESWDEPQFIDTIELEFERTGLPFKFQVYGTTTDDEKVVLLDKLDNIEPLDESYTIDTPNEEFKSITVYFDASYEGTEWPAIAELDIYGEEEYSISFLCGDYGVMDGDESDISTLCYDGESFPDVPTIQSDNSEYIFEGWMNKYGEIIKNFPQYVTSNETYTAIWKKTASDKNTSTSDNKLADTKLTKTNTGSTDVKTVNATYKTTPKTGDNADVSTYLTICILSILSIIFIKLYYKK